MSRNAGMHGVLEPWLGKWSEPHVEGRGAQRDLRAAGRTRRPRARGIRGQAIGRRLPQHVALRPSSITRQRLSWSSAWKAPVIARRQSSVSGYFVTHGETDDMTRQVAVNCRYLLWRKDVPREDWARWLQRHTGLRAEQCLAIVEDRQLDSDFDAQELRELGRAFQHPDDGEALRFSDLARDGCNVLQENLRHLFGSLGHGGKQTVAERLSINPTTISRWLNGSFEPQSNTLESLARFFGLPPDTDLRTVPVFLSVDPLSVAARREWVKLRVDDLSGEELAQLFPALRRLLGEQR